MVLFVKVILSESATTRHWTDSVETWVDSAFWANLKENYTFWSSKTHKIHTFFCLLQQKTSCSLKYFSLGSLFGSRWHFEQRSSSDMYGTVYGPKSCGNKKSLFPKDFTILGNSKVKWLNNQLQSKFIYKEPFKISTFLFSHVTSVTHLNFKLCSNIKCVWVSNRWVFSCFFFQNPINLLVLSFFLILSLSYFC